MNWIGNKFSLGAGYLFLLCGLCGCGGEEEVPPVAPEPSGTEEGGSQENNAMQAEPSAPEGRLRIKPDKAPVLLEMNGLYYRVYEIDETPYSGKIMEYHDNGIEKKEIVYAEGALAQITEWRDNGKKKMEVKIGADGVRQESYWDQSGNLQGKPVAAAEALGRKMVWTFSVNQKSINIAYRGKSSEVIRKGFGEPDENQNGVWVYQGMKVQTVQGLMTTVRFLMQNEIVVQVSVEP
ncbi:MAG: hypothetical protein VX945_05800 [Verrucomicrobiota bacterium]|nr:hypothetical protein [Verrucomicrobiota bacterium]